MGGGGLAPPPFPSPEAKPSSPIGLVPHRYIVDYNAIDRTSDPDLPIAEAAPLEGYRERFNQRCAKDESDTRHAKGRYV